MNPRISRHGGEMLFRYLKIIYLTLNLLRTIIQIVFHGNFLMNNNNYYRSMMKTEPGTRESHSTSVEGVWFYKHKDHGSKSHHVVDSEL